MAKRLWRIFRVLLGFALLCAIAAAGVLVAAYREVERGLPDLHRLEDYAPPLTTRVLARDGRLIGEFFDERRTLVPIGEIPNIVKLAFVASEDDTFFEHRGLDYRSILRAAWVNLRAGGRVRQGGSTITQQVAKSILSSERSLLRKAKDMLLAQRIEQRFTKDEILHLYLNQIYLGNGAYGVAEAARSYFGKPLRDLTAGEAALIAGLPKAPTEDSPFNDPEGAEQRRQYVLRRMLEERFIDEATHRTAVATRPQLAPPPERGDELAAAVFTEEVRRLLYDRLGRETTLRGGLVVETTLDLERQRLAIRSLRDGLEALEARHGSGQRGPSRRVTEADANAELATIARANGLAKVAQGERAVLLPERHYTGLVRNVDAAAGVARVAVAPGVERSVRTADLEAIAKRPAGLAANASLPPAAITSVLTAGDVGRFRVILPGEGESEERLRPIREARVEGALVSIDVASGDVVALIGGYDFERSEFDRATQALRQPGSSFKPFVYGAAIEHGYAPTSIVLDTPVEVIDPGSGQLWHPENYTKRFLGAITAREALARSINNATVRLYMDVGIDETISFARRLGIRSPLGRHLSLALGSTEVTLLELTGAYATIAAGGRRLPPRFISRVLDRHGTVLLHDVPLGDLSLGEDPPAEASHTTGNPVFDPTGAQGSPGRQAMTPANAYLLTDLLRATIEEKYGTAHRAAALGRPLAGKTGTTNDQKDAWFVGFSPELVSGVWVGHDAKEVLGKKETGGHAALPIWISYMSGALANVPVADFPVPDGIVFARVNRQTGQPTDADDPASRFQPFAEGALPGSGSFDSDEDMPGGDGSDPLRDDAF